MSFRGHSKTETLVKLTLILVISLLAFSIGTFVGKQFSDAQYKMAALEPDYDVERGTASEKEHAGETLSESDISKLTEEFVNAERASLNEKQETTHDAVAETHETKHETQHETKQEKHTTAHKVAAPKQHKKMKHKETSHAPKATHTVAKAADRVVEDKAPTSAKVEKKRTPTALPKTVSANTLGKFTVQVAAYATESEAKQHSQKLVDDGFNGFYLAAAVKGKTWYRVSVGLFGTRNAATNYKSVFLKQAGVSSAIVQKIVR